MKFKNIILSCLVSCSLFSCYDDKGNYDYKDINLLEIDGIEASYAYDVDDSLNIYPKLEGTIYNDTTLFTYEWQIGNVIKGRSHDLNMLITMYPGSYDSRFIVTDKSTNIKSYANFDLRVSSSTAGDLIVVLGKVNNKAELSYLRLDKPSKFAVNYYENRFGKSLGNNPQQLHFTYCETSYGGAFTTIYGKVQVLVDDVINQIDKRTMGPDTLNSVIKGESYTGVAAYPKPDIEGYKSEYIVEEGITMWRKSFYGSGNQIYSNFYEISNGALYFAALDYSKEGSCNFKQESPYSKGNFSSFAYYAKMDPTPHNNTGQAGYDTGDLILFDNKNGRFAYGSYGVPREIKLENVKAFEGHDLIYGSATVMPDQTSLSILRTGSSYRMLLMKKSKVGKDQVYSITAELLCNNSTINETTEFYVLQKSPILIYTTDKKVYSYNLLDIAAGVMPNESNVIANLSDCGYTGDATITSMFVTRTEQTILLGVSRYGSDSSGSGDELKGDIVHLDFNNSTTKTQYNAERSFRGISGIPVDVKVKYQTHRRDGLDYDDILVDNI